MKLTLRYPYGYLIIICCWLFFPKTVSAQTDADGQMIAKKFLCVGAMYTTSDWTNYWEGTFKRNNANIGKLTTNTYSAFGNYGITNRLDVLFTLPYVTTNASQGTLRKQKGLQDFELTLKWQPLDLKIGKTRLTAFAILSGTTPMSNYDPDSQPLSIGIKSKTASLRGLVNYSYDKLFIAGAAQYIRRSNITLDRTSYYATDLVNSNEVDIPNGNNIIISTGYRSVHLNVEAIYENSTSLGGFDIRKDDMPFPGNTMNWSKIGGLVKYTFNQVAGLELTAGSNYVLTGRNVGQATTIYGGVLYLFNFSKNK